MGLEVFPNAFPSLLFFLDPPSLSQGFWGKNHFLFGGGEKTEGSWGGVGIMSGLLSAGCRVNKHSRVRKRDSWRESGLGPWHAHTQACTHVNTCAHTRAGPCTSYLRLLSRLRARTRSPSSLRGRAEPLRGKKRKGSGFLERRTDGTPSLSPKEHRGEPAVGEHRDKVKPTCSGQEGICPCCPKKFGNPCPLLSILRRQRDFQRSL